MIMKTRGLALLAMSWFVLAGCESAPHTAVTAVQLGMSRSDLKLYFGEPLRIERVAPGGEDWYYRFAAWKARPTSEAGNRVDFGQNTSYVSVGVEVSKDTEEHPIHVSSEGYVIRPLPDGKVVKE
jgi:outer membrane protein assembly factor BamE (lipoprotein component of BamABCDE complex)